MTVVLTEVVRRSQRRENTGEELQTHLDLSAVAVPARSPGREEEEEEEKKSECVNTSTQSQSQV